MGNQNSSPNENNQEHSTFYDQADGNFDKAIQNAQGSGATQNQEKLSKGVTSEENENAGSTYSKNLIGDAEGEVRENENASLQDDSYSFDEANTDNEEYHDADEVEDFDIDNDDDFVQ